MFSISGRSGLPIFPPTCTVFPSACNIFAIRVVVVVLPSEPVTAKIVAGQISKNTSISLVTAIPLLRAASSSGRLKLIPGVLKIISTSRLSRYPSPNFNSAPAFSSLSAMSPICSLVLRSQAITLAPLSRKFSISGVLLIPIPHIAIFLPLIWSKNCLKSNFIPPRLTFTNILC